MENNQIYSNEYKFTETWFDHMIPAWEKIFNDYKIPIQSVLEIGCYEGRATVWLCENVLNNNNINHHYDVVDTFGGSLDESGMEKTKKLLEQDNFIENNFKHNINVVAKKYNINFYLYKGKSQTILPSFEPIEKYDFIYIDASHRADDTFVDAYYAHKMLKKGGIIIFDDYGWGDPKNTHQVNSPKLGVDVFNWMYNDKYQILLEGYQVGLIKIE